MNKVDDMIGRALTDEDRALLARHTEQGYVAQAFGIFRGPMAGAIRVAYVTSVLAFVAAAWALWRMASASDVLAAVQWGVAGVVLFQLATMTKTFLGQHLEANRTLRELKRLELQVSLLRGEHRP